MPEFKRNFTGGKMNKDLNERLVPKGEYRDAMNIEVSTSEGSDVGTVQNILGNKAIEGQSMIPPNSVCVATISDEKNDAIYWFTTQKSWGSQPYNKINLTHEDPQGLENARRDCIWEYKNNILEPVFCGVGAISYVAYDSAGMNITWSTSNNTIQFNEVNVLLVGMDLEISGYVVNAGGVLVEETISGFTVQSVSGGQITVAGDISFLDNSTTQLQLENTKFFFTVSDGLNTPLNFDSNKIISSINIIDDMLFWSDTYDEPKKINIPRSKLGTPYTSSKVFPTRLINEALDLGSSAMTACKKEHITVIRKAPLRPPNLYMSASKRGQLGVVEMYPPPAPFSQIPFSGVLAGDSILMFVDAIGGVNPDLRVGDVIKLLNVGASGSISDDYLVRCSIVEKYEGPDSVVTLTSTISFGSSKTLYKLKIQSITTLTGGAIDTATTWNAELQDEDVLFERKFARFAYRYKYIDNEYSSFSPFSEVAFLPGAFSYQPTKANNEAMLNRLKFLAVQDFVPRDIPLDVISVDILYKNEVSPTIYLLDTVSPQDLIPPNKSVNPWNSSGSSSGPEAHRGSLDITTESIYAALPENQILRSWDNVPKTAVAQEVTNNRLVYGNYTQGYKMSLSEFSSNTLTPIINTLLNNRPTSDLGANRSIKSLRSYDIGVVWGDKYGRETPVFSSSQGSVVVAKNESVSSNYFSVELNDSPYWADYYRFYIKETSNEYYNLPVGRVYDAADGNIWVAFPSVDRNKVQEDTYIILKKGMDSNNLIKEEARYKIVAIENEAPEFVKTSYDIIAQTNTDASKPSFSCDMWGGNFVLNTGCSYASPVRPPEPGYKSFTLDYDIWSGAWSTGATQMGLPLLHDMFKEVQANDVTDELWVEFSSDVSQRTSTRYLVTGVDLLDDGTDPILYNVHLDQPIFGTTSDNDDSFVTNNIDGGTSNNTPDEIHVYFYKRSIKNKPEFDGRFFVKIYKDFIANQYLVKPGQPVVTDNLIQRATVPIFKISDPGLNSNGTIFDYNNAGGTATGPAPNSTTATKQSWIDNLKMNSNTTGAYWFIDNATFGSIFQGNLDSNKRGDFAQITTASTQINVLDPSITLAGNSSNVTTSEGHTTYHWCGNVAAVTMCGGYGQSCPSSHSYSGTGKSTGRVGMKGVWTNPAGDHFIDLGFSKFGPSEQQTGNTTNSKVNWGIGVSENPVTVSEASVVGSLAIDQRFQFANDPLGVMYKVLAVQKFRLFNFQGVRTIHASYGHYDGSNVLSGTGFNCNDAWSSAFISMNRDMHKDYNRRTSYRVRYEIDSDLTQNTYSGYNSTDSLSDHPLYLGMSGTNSENIDFLDSYETEEETVISSNPAIFETEPKESVDLDIYYEASSSIPVFPITNNNKYSFIPVGTTFLPSPRSSSLSTVNWTNVFITRWANISENSTSNTIYLSTPVSISDLFALLNDADGNVEMMKDSGETISIKISGVEYDANNDVIALKIEPQKRVGLSWFNCWSFNNGVESNRVGDTFNNPFISNGVAASTTTDTQYAEEHRKYGLIYSGIYNSTSGVNNLNQFIQAEKITKDINPVYGSIQKLKAGWGQGGDLITLCEDRVLKILANKDALYNADGNTNITSTNNVLGQAIPYSGEYGISKNPESFASEAYRAYFTDKVRGAVLRLSMDGLTPISNYGMSDWFKDNLGLSSRAVGSFDDNKNEYNVSLSNTISLQARVPAVSRFPGVPPYYAQNTIEVYKLFGNQIVAGDIISGIGIASGSTVVGKTLNGQWYEVELDLEVNGDIIGPVNSAADGERFWNTTIYIDKSSSNTVTYKEKIKGWVSFKSFIPEQAGSMANNYYTFKDGKAWIHHSKTVSRNTFYGGESDNSWIEAVINDMPGSVKSFKAVDYEGSQAKVTSKDENGATLMDSEYFNLSTEKGWYVSDFYTNLEHGSVSEFVEKEGKWFGHTIGSDISINPDGVITNNYDTSDFSVQGIGGFTSTIVNVMIGCMCDGVVNDCYGDGSAAFNYSPAASAPCNTSAPNDCCIPIKYGCIDPDASNLDPLANTDDGSCIYLGCIDEYGPNGILNSNFDPNANTSDGSCIEYVPGCTDVSMFNYSATATIACGGDVPIPGDPLGQANNYCCEPVVEGCIDPNAAAITGNTNNNTCEYPGCTDPTATNYSFLGTTVDGTTGIQSDLAYQYGFAVDDGSCLLGPTPTTFGCTDANADNYDATVNTDDGSCQYCNNVTPPIPMPNAGVPASFINDHFEAVITHETTAGNNDGIIQVTIPPTSPFGSDCTLVLHDSGGSGYSVGIVGNVYTFTGLHPDVYSVTITQGASTYVGNQLSPCVQVFSSLLQVNTGATIISGCTDGAGNFNNYIMSTGFLGTHAACNYNPLATNDDGSCEYSSCIGCMDPFAANYDATNQFPDNGVCSYSGLPVLGCTDPTANNYDANADTNDGSCTYDVFGCIDPTADNYDATATVDDGSCTYAAPAYQIGDSLGGGIIAYFFQPGDSGYVANEQHGIIGQTTVSNQVQNWGCSGSSIPITCGYAVGCGASNTQAIIDNCSSVSAASIAGALVEGGFSDWVLPSRDELHKVYANIGDGSSVGAFVNFDPNGTTNDVWYWSSNEISSTHAIRVSLSDTSDPLSAGFHSSVAKVHHFNLYFVRYF